MTEREYTPEEREKIEAAWREIFARNPLPEQDNWHCGRCGRCRELDFKNCKNRRLW